MEKKWEKANTNNMDETKISHECTYAQAHNHLRKLAEW